MDLVTFLLPAYKAKFLKAAIQSILDQSYTNFELVIVDDYSPENLENIVKQFNDPRISYFKNEKNIGGKNLVEQWNHCLQYAKGEYLILAADDDIYETNFLTDAIAVTKSFPKLDIVHSPVKIINENDEIIGLDALIPEYSSKMEFVFYWLSAAVFTCIGNYMFRTSKIKELKFIDFPSAFGSDTASVIQMADHGMGSIDSRAFNFRISSIHLSSNLGKIEDKLKANTQLFNWLKNIEFPRPRNPIDVYCLHEIRWEKLYAKCMFDYYQLVIKHLPVQKLGMIRKCTILTPKDQFKLILRYFRDKIMRK